MYILSEKENIQYNIEQVGNNCLVELGYVKSTSGF